MHRVIECTKIDGIVRFYTDTAYCLTINVTDIVPSPAANWIKLHLGPEVIDNLDLSIGKSFESLPNISTDMINVTIC